MYVKNNNFEYINLIIDSIKIIDNSDQTIIQNTKLNQ